MPPDDPEWDWAREQARKYLATPEEKLEQVLEGNTGELQQVTEIVAIEPVIVVTAKKDELGED